MKGFSTRLLVSVLATLTALEPMALAANGSLSDRLHVPGADSYPDIREFVVTYPGKELPFDGKLDRYHTGLDAAGNTTDWNSITSPNASAFMYALRDTAVLGALEKQIGLRYLLGGERHAGWRLQSLRGEYFNGWIDQFHQRALNVDFRMPGEHSYDLYLGDGTPTPRIAQYAEWLQNPANDPGLVEGSERANEDAHRAMMPFIIERSLQLVEADATLKYYYHDFPETPSVKDPLVEYQTEQHAKGCFPKPSEDRTSCLAGAYEFGKNDYHWWTQEANEVGPDKKTPVDFPLPGMLRANRADILAAQAYKEKLSDSPLLTAFVPQAPHSVFSKGKELPLYVAVYEFLQEELKHQGNAEVRLPDPRQSYVPANAKAPGPGEKIPPPVAFSAQLERAKRFLGGMDADREYATALDNGRIYRKMADLIDVASLSYLFSTQRLIESLTKRVGWDGDLGSNWANLVSETGIVTRTMRDYSYFDAERPYHPGRSPSSVETLNRKVHIDFAKAVAQVNAAVQKHRENVTTWINRFTIGLLGVEVVGMLGALVFAPETEPLLGAVFEFTATWQIELILALGGLVLAFERWNNSETRREVMEQGFLAVPDDSFGDVQDAVQVEEQDWSMMMRQAWFGLGLGVFRRLAVVGIKSAAAAGGVRKLLISSKGKDSLEEGGEALASSLQAQGKTGRARITALRRLLEGPLGAVLPKLKAALNAVGGVLRMIKRDFMTPAMFWDVIASIGTQIYFEKHDPDRDLSTANGKITAFNDIATSALYTIALNIALARTVTFSKKILPSGDAFERSSEMSERIKALQGNWTLKQRLLSAALFHLTACPIGYVSGVSGDLLTQAIQKSGNLDRVLDKDGFRDAISEANAHGVFLCGYAQWTAVRMQAIRGLNTLARVGLGGANVYKGVSLAEEAAHVTFPAGRVLGRQIVPAGVSAYGLKAAGYTAATFSTGWASNIIGAKSYAMFSRWLGAEKAPDRSKVLPDSPEMLEKFVDYAKAMEDGKVAGFSIEKRLDPVGDLFAPLAGVYDLAPLPKDSSTRPAITDADAQPQAPATPPTGTPAAPTPAPETPAPEAPSFNSRIKALFDRD